jgi:hypothetical protein
LKVADLAEGMIVRPIVNKYTQRRMHFDVKREVAVGENKDKSVSVVYCSASRRDSKQDIAIYVGSERSDLWVQGVKTHHYLLVGGETAIISGYEVRYLEPAV